MKKVIFCLALFLLYVHMHAQGFEKNIFIGDNSLNEAAYFVKDYEGSLYIHLAGGCIVDNDTIACSAIAKYDYQGNELWTHVLPNHWLPQEKSFDIVKDTIYTVGKNAKGNKEKFHNFYLLDTMGQFISNTFLHLDTLKYEDVILRSIIEYDDHIILAGNGLTPESRLPGVIFVFDKQGQQVQELYWYPENDGFNFYTIFDLVIHPINQMLHFVVFENGGNSSVDIKARRSLYRYDYKEDNIDAIYQTMNEESDGILQRSRYRFTEEGDIVYWDDDNENSFGLDIYIAQRDYELGANGEVIWDYVIPDDDHPELYDMSEAAATDLIIGKDGNVYLTGEKNWFLWSDSLWRKANSYIVKFNKSGELLWERLIYEKSTGVLPTNIQYLRSMVELSDQSLIGVGPSHDWQQDEIDQQNGWLLRLNEFGCFDDDQDCPYLLEAKDSVSTVDYVSESLPLKYHPNPASDYCMVSIPENMSGILRLITTGGGIVKEIKIKSGDNEKEVNLTGLRQGGYVLLFTPEDKIEMMYNSLLIIK